MLGADWTECGVAMCRSQPQSGVGIRTLYINVEQSFEIIHAPQELQLCIRQSITVYNSVLSITEFTIVNDIKHCTIDST